ncbi:MAG: type II toxin-antitoxin system HicA family toxin [Deltaproteobacteria bacterium]|nr:type II toxin-antitoxin system HicA family toxin [Deltaproteobacteria bacterium]
MTAREVLLVIKARGGVVVRRRGSHVRIKAGKCFATVPDHGSHDMPPGTLRSIERQLEPCFGKGWLRS